MHHFSQDLVTSLYLQQIWTDYRLEFEQDIPNAVSIGIPDKYYGDLWLPDVYIENSKTGMLHQVTKTNRMFRVFRNGTVYYSER